MRQDLENRLHDKCYELVKAKYGDVQGADKFLELFPSKDAFLKSFLRVVRDQTDEQEDLFLMDCFRSNEGDKTFEVARLKDAYHNMVDEETKYMEQILQRMATWLREVKDEEDDSEDDEEDDEEGDDDEEDDDEEDDDEEDDEEEDDDEEDDDEDEYESEKD